MDYENKRPPYHPPKPPHPPHPPKPEPVKFQSINTVLTKKVNNTIYELMVRTTTDQVLDKNGVTVTEQLSNIFDLLTTSKREVKEIRDEYDRICGDAPEFFNSFKEVWDYVNVNGDPKSELLKLINSKVESEEGKGLSTNDFTDILKEKLEKGYTAKELDEKFVSEAASEGLVNLKGHKVIGGLRASIYNAMPYEGVVALVDFMKKFERDNNV